ncbi:ORF I polyprotein [Corchorus capsularis]|uniref:ORF I polyprotein n=1 Tax=Corchorus capsularis TaxID=210143 RepID=A0A1R3IYZ5_COCAP|nr:ORF I polyprotein [Corchorus capsularis]
MAVFYQMLDVKKKTVPNTQLLRWSQWFTRYSFTTRHIKSKHNLIPDMLSTPPKPPKESLQVLPVIASIMNYVLGLPPPKKKKDKNEEVKALKTNPFGNKPTQPPPIRSIADPDLAFPPELIEILTFGKFETGAYHHMLKYQMLILRSFGETVIAPLGVNPVYPFVKPLPLVEERCFPEQYKELQKKLCEINATIPTSVMETFEFDAKEHYPDDYKAKINIDRMVFTEKFTRPFNRPLAVDAKANLLQAVAVSWNPLWTPPEVTNEHAPPEDPIPYWEDTECPISLGNNSKHLARKANPGSSSALEPTPEEARRKEKGKEKIKEEYLWPYYHPLDPNFPDSQPPEPTPEEEKLWIDMTLEAEAKYAAERSLPDKLAQLPISQTEPKNTILADTPY